MRDAALDCGGFCADLLTKGLAFVGNPGKLLLSKTGFKREIVNSRLLPQRTSSRLAISSHCRNQYPARLGSDPSLSRVGSNSNPLSM